MILSFKFHSADFSVLPFSCHLSNKKIIPFHGVVKSRQGFNIKIIILEQTVFDVLDYSNHGSSG